MKRFFSLLLCIIMSAGMLVGCGGNTSTKQESTDSIIIPVASTVTTMNRLLEGMKEGYLMLAPFSDELFYKSADGTRYYLAESCKISEDGLTYTVKLRDNLKWHDGEAITADDLMFTMECIADTDNGTDFTGAAFINDKEVKVNKVDELTVEFKIPEASASYETKLGAVTIIPEHIFEGNTDIKSAEANLKDIGSGPYKLKEFKDGESLVLEKFEDYYGDEPQISTVAFKVISDVSAQEVAMQNGEINLMELADSTAVEKYSTEENYQVHEFPEGRVNYMAWNKYSDTWENKDALEAVFYAIDAQEIIDGAYGSVMAKKANSILSNVNMYYDESIKGYEQDLEKAKELAESSGLTSKTLKLYYNADRAYMEQSALIIQQQLKSVGITLEIEGVESNGFFDIVFGDASDYDLYLNGYGAATDPDEVIAGMFDGTWGINIDTSDEILDLFKKGRSTTDESEREAIYKEIQKKAVEQKTIYPIAYPNYNFVSLKTLDGADLYRHTPIFEDYSKLSYK